MFSSLLNLFRNRLRTLKLRLFDDVRDLTDAATLLSLDSDGRLGTGGFSKGSGPRKDSLRPGVLGVGSLGGESFSLSDEYAESGGIDCL